MGVEQLERPLLLVAAGRGQLGAEEVVDVVDGAAGAALLVLLEGGQGLIVVIFKVVLN